MAFFQNSVLNKHLKSQDEDAVKSAYERFTAYFHDASRQQNIRDSKEEQFQEGFLRELFVKILGYTLNPEPHFNLTTELKNEKGAKKTDGAILKDGKALGVVELKGTDTKDLDKVNEQAFNYKNNHSACVYVITSNFEKLRFFIHNAVEHIEFNLFALSLDEFKILWLCLNADTLLSGVPLRVKEESLLAEENITKQLYKDYSAFRTDLWQNMVKNHPDDDQLMMFKKTQKLLDRFLFIFFSEDSGLLPPNSISRIIEKWNHDKDWGESKSLYEIYKQYFSFINSGRPASGNRAEIFGYNGGLFLEDLILDNIKIDDDVLLKHTEKLTAYDFQSEVDVNILGHIFENSLNEIENITAELEGQEIDKSKTKRKKDGVFYTPKYITKYIVDNTIGNLCEEKKAELTITDERFGQASKRSRKGIADLKAYRDWLLGLKICDPACGSGAFLNQALEFLIDEHRYLDELTAQYHKSPLVLSDIETHILEQNIYGVDINDESVEIAKLSLWLRTAQRGRKLTSLNNNIKCGNSLIDDSAIAGEKAFNWKKEFSKVFEKGGFDVIIGNPPYLRVQGLRENFEMESKYYESAFQSATGRFDIYVLFMERSFELISDIGKVGFILPHKFMVSDFGEGIRTFLSDNMAIESLVHFGSEMVFADASTYTCIITLSKKNQKVLFKEMKPKGIFSPFEFDEMDATLLTNEKWNLQSGDVSGVMSKIKKQKFTVKDVFEWISQGVVSVGDDIFLLKGRIDGYKFIGFSEKVGKEVVLEASLMKPLLKGEDVKKYAPLEPSYFVIYPHYEKDGKTLPYEEEVFKQQFPLAYSYFLPYKEELIEKKVRYKTNVKYWYSLHRSREMSLFESKKIVTPETSFGTNMTIDEDGYFHNTQVYTLIKKSNIQADERYLLSILNSQVMWFFLKNTGTILRGGYFRYKTKYLEPFPVPMTSGNEQQPFIEKVKEIKVSTSGFKNLEQQFVTLMQSKFDIEKLSKKLQSWHELEFKDFLKELKKVKVQMGLPEEAEWMQYFSEQKQKAQELKSEINRVDAEIDQMVYRLYGLTNDEIKVVEGN